MPTAHISFCRPLTPDTATGFLTGCKIVSSELDQATKKPKWTTLDISISSGGGDVVSSFGLYNELKGFPVDITTRNSGAVDSAAIMPFLAGRKRYACASSAFFFHQTAWSFPSQNGVSMVTVNDAGEWLSHYQKMMAELVASKTTLKADEVHQLMLEGRIMTPQEAKKCGLVDDVVEFSLPAGARWHQL